jgi:cytochrome c551/c552
VKGVLKVFSFLFLFFFFSCETKSAKEEPVVICGTSSTKDYRLRESMPVEVTENCISCHDLKDKLVGPSFAEISKKMYKKEKIISMLKKPSKFNDTNKSKIPHPKFDYINDSSLVEITRWIDSVWYYSIYLD